MGVHVYAWGNYEQGVECTRYAWMGMYGVGMGVHRVCVVCVCMRCVYTGYMFAERVCVCIWHLCA